jgi:hypothetical protein
MLNRNAKFFVAVLAAIGAWSTLVIQSAPHAITSTEWGVGLGYLLAAAIVWLTPNTPTPVQGS